MLRKKGQTIFEYIVLIVLVIAVFISMGSYIKRGMQGRWKEAMDDIGDQYDPRVADVEVLHTITAESTTFVETREDVDGHWTFREDITNAQESKVGTYDIRDEFPQDAF
ncbi:MAG: hypothetical protein GY861_23860 [bacterium]|nr:hypothetical protein [bacterium]